LVMWCVSLCSSRERARASGVGLSQRASAPVGEQRAAADRPSSGGATEQSRSPPPTRPQPHPLDRATGLSQVVPCRQKWARGVWEGQERAGGAQTTETAPLLSLCPTPPSLRESDPAQASPGLPPNNHSLYSFPSARTSPNVLRARCVQTLSTPPSSVHFSLQNSKRRRRRDKGEAPSLSPARAREREGVSLTRARAPHDHPPPLSTSEAQNTTTKQSSSSLLPSLLPQATAKPRASARPPRPARWRRGVRQTRSSHARAAPRATPGALKGLRGWAGARDRDAAHDEAPGPLVALPLALRPRPLPLCLLASGGEASFVPLARQPRQRPRNPKPVPSARALQMRPATQPTPTLGALSGRRAVRQALPSSRALACFALRPEARAPPSSASFRRRTTPWGPF